MILRGCTLYYASICNASSQFTPIQLTGKLRPIRSKLVMFIYHPSELGLNAHISEVSTLTTAPSSTFIRTGPTKSTEHLYNQPQTDRYTALFSVDLLTPRASHVEDSRAHRTSIRTELLSLSYARATCDGCE